MLPEYGAPTSADKLKERLVNIGMGGLIVRLKVLSAVETPLLALTVNEADPFANGVPEMVFPDKERPSA
jgi:hypothetical protein